MKPKGDKIIFQSLNQRSLAQAIGLACLLVTGMRANAVPLINGGFESGDFAGWALNAPLYPMYLDGVMSTDPSTITGYQPEGTASVLGGAVDAAEGQSYALLFQNDVGGPGREPGVLRSLNLSQNILLNEGQRVAGYASWACADYLAADSGWVSILGADGLLLATPWLRGSGSSSPYNSYPLSAGPPPFDWVFWEWVAPATGTYTLQLGIGSFDDGLFGGAAYFDGITVSSVPDAGCTLALLLVSVMGVRSLAARLRKSS